MSQEITIIGSETSPFVRIVRMIAEELDVVYKMDPTSFYVRNTPEQEAHVQTNNPLMKIPVLIHDEDTVFESRVIATYLLKNFKPRNDFRTNFLANVTEDNILSTIYGIIDSGVLRFVMKNGHPEINMEAGYMARSLTRMHSGLKWLDRQPVLGKSFGVPEAALICALDWFTKRNVIDWSAYKNLAAVKDKFKSRESVVKTRIPEDA